MHTVLAVSHLLFATLTLIGPLMALTLLRRPLDASAAARLRQVDAANAVAATLVLLIGLARIFYFGKGLDYYLHSLPFLLKMGLYGVASGLSLVCTLEVRRWAAPLRAGQLPLVSARKVAHMRTALAWQAVCVLGMALCASLAARGIGSF